MSSRKFISDGNYRLVLENGRLVIQRPDDQQGVAAIEIGYDGVNPSGWIGVTNGAFKYGFDASVPFDVYHEGRPPDITEIDLLDQDFPSARVPNVLYVAESGLDGNTGDRLSSPKRTIKSALARADYLQALSMGHRILSGQDQTNYNRRISNGRYLPGSGHAINDELTMTDGSVVTVTQVDGGGGVTGFNVDTGGTSDVLPRRSVVTQTTSSGTGSEFALIPGDANCRPTRVRTPVKIFLKAGRYRENNPLIVNRKVGIWGDSLRTAFVSPRRKPFLTRANLARVLLPDSTFDNARANTGDPNAISAANEIEANRSTIIASVESFIDNAPWQTDPAGPLLNPSQRSRCLRDTGLILDAIIRDLSTSSVGTHPTSGYPITNDISLLSTTYHTERAAAYYYQKGQGKIPPDQLGPTLETLEHLRVSALSSLTPGPGQTIARELVQLIEETVRFALTPGPGAGDPVTDTAIAALESNRASLQNGVRAWISNPSNVTPGLLSSGQQDLCVRDVGLIIDAVVADLRDGTIDKSEHAALAYYRQGAGVIPLDQRQVTINALEELISEVLALPGIPPAGPPSPALDVRLRVQNLFELSVKTIEQPIDQIRPPTVTVNFDAATGAIVGATVDDGGFGYRGDPQPNAALLDVVNPPLGAVPPLGQGFDDAASRLRFNRSFIQEMVADYVDFTYQQGPTPLMTPEQFALCKRDVGYILDAIISDLRQGGTEETQEAALNYFISEASVLPASQQAPTVDTFAQIARLANRIVRNIPVTELYPGQSIGALLESQKTPGGFPVSEFVAVALAGPDPEPAFNANDVSNYGLIGEMIQGLNQTIVNPDFPSDLVVSDVFGDVQRIDTDIPEFRPAILSFQIENHSIVSAEVLDGGAIVEESPPGSGTFVPAFANGEPVSSLIPEPDDGFDLFYVNNGCYFGGMTFNDLSGRASAVAFDQLRRDPLEASETKGFITTSPYVQNCSTINPREEGGVGMKINGRHVRGLRSMVSDAFTQINTGGTGVYLLNRGYAQLVSIFTVSTNIGILAESGGQCSVANSNSSFGNFGLISRGVSEVLEDATVVSQLLSTPQAEGDFGGRFSGGTGYSNGDRIILNNDAEVQVDTVGGDGNVLTFTLLESGAPWLENQTLRQARTVPAFGSGEGFTLTPTPANFDAVEDAGANTYPTFSTEFILQIGENSRLPAFGDAVLFEQVYADTSGSDPVNQIYEFAGLNTLISDEPRIQILYQGEPVPRYTYEITRRAPNLQIRLLPGFTDVYPAFTLPPNPNANDLTARFTKYYTVEDSTEIQPSGLVKVTLDLGITQTVDTGTLATFHQRSLITSSAHTFEYVGAGTNFLEATPAAGGKPIRANEIIQDRDLGGSVYFTSTDDKGDFKIGPELTINRNTGTITGEAFERSLFTVLTPYILSLE